VRGWGTWRGLTSDRSISLDAVPLTLSLAEDLGGMTSGLSRDPARKPVNSPLVMSFDRRRSDCDVAVRSVGDVGDSTKDESLLSRLGVSRRLFEEARGEGVGRPSLLPGARPNGLLKPFGGDGARTKDPWTLCRLRPSMVPNRLRPLLGSKTNIS